MSIKMFFKYNFTATCTYELSTKCYSLNCKRTSL